MATVYNAAPGTNYAMFNPVSAALANLPNDAGTIAALYAKDAAAGLVDCSGLTTGSPTVSEWYHTAGHQNVSSFDDDGIVGVSASLSSGSVTDWGIIVTSWPAGGAALERHHWTSVTNPGAWQHANTGGNNGGNRAGPTTANGRWRIGYFGDFSGSGGYGLAAAWAGVQLTDLQVQELAVNKRTSDWWNCSAGQPTLLVECTSLTLTDIGANPSTFSSNNGLTIADPAVGALTTWTFDGQGESGTPDRRMAQRHSRGTSW